MNLRKANNADAPKIKDLVFSILEEYGLKTDPINTDADLENIEMSYNKRGGIFKVLEDENREIFGCVGLYPIEGETVELRKMYLAKSQRGKGLGKLMLEDALQTAKELGFTEMILETAGVLKEAVALYLAYGFEYKETGHLSSRCDRSMYLKLKD